MTLLPANLRMGTVSGAVPLFPTVVTLLRLGTVGNLMSWLSAPSAHLWLRAVRGTMAQLPTIVATFRFRTRARGVEGRRERHWRRQGRVLQAL